MKTITDEVVVVKNGKTFVVDKKTWGLIMDCAGQMLDADDAYDYYRNFVPKAEVTKAYKAYRELK